MTNFLDELYVAQRAAVIQTRFSALGRTACLRAKEATTAESLSGFEIMMAAAWLCKAAAWWLEMKCHEIYGPDEKLAEDLTNVEHAITMIDTCLYHYELSLTDPEYYLHVQV